MNEINRVVVTDEYTCGVAVIMGPDHSNKQASASSDYNATAAAAADDDGDDDDDDYHYYDDGGGGVNLCDGVVQINAEVMKEVSG
ncbi:unnamed protein product [Schistocephalus solidus]|uniref:Uncharacterized protein n=1 Tax=Schistocephalus solidus TaxID=70667 RepID=A0A183T7V1_SCHSO|nr:unnamed protein product [Schistocephalus solidus]